MSQPSTARRLATAARWPTGVVLTSWRYLWRTTPMRRDERPGIPDEDLPPPLAAEVRRDDLQPPEDGYGPLLHRRYRVRIRDAQRTPTELMGLLQSDPDCVAPSEFATFQKTLGDEGQLRVNDELLVRMAAPWDGPVRVAEVTPTSHLLATLAGHIEAGQIDFSAREEDGAIAVTIEAWARSGDRVSNVLFDRLPMAKEVQLHMWVSYLERIIELSGGQRCGPLEVITRRLEGSSLSSSHVSRSMRSEAAR